ncbi:MAG: hypothetical protein ACKV0T_14680 [Planctomycetales bacterium]
MKFTESGSPVRWVRTSLAPEAATASYSPGSGFSTDLVLASEIHNDVYHPERLNGHTSAEAWNARTAITVTQRDVFLATVARHRQHVLSQWDRAPDAPHAPRHRSLPGRRLLTEKTARRHHRCRCRPD